MGNIEKWVDKNEKYQRDDSVKQKRTRMVEDGQNFSGLEMTILTSLANFFKIHTNDDVAPFCFSIDMAATVRAL